MFNLESEYDRYRREAEFATIEGYNEEGEKIGADKKDKKALSKTLLSLFMVGTIGSIGYFGYDYMQNEVDNSHKTVVMGVSIKNSKDEFNLNREEIEKSLDSIYQEEQDSIKLNKAIDSVMNEFVTTKKESAPLTDISSELNGIVDMFYTQEAIPAELDSMVDNFYLEQSSLQEGRFIIVKDGDTLAKISQKFYGSTMEYQKIVEANYRLQKSTTLYIGQQINIPY